MSKPKSESPATDVKTKRLFYSPYLFKDTDELLAFRRKLRRRISSHSEILFVLKLADHEVGVKSGKVRLSNADALVLVQREYDNLQQLHLAIFGSDYSNENTKFLTSGLIEKIL